ncbi:hypothetical protein c7_R434 [Megavirus courdo7]|uniref:Uncharacterized protein n=1 Tax=Megavirus courdo7 TaxID=1128135 RepID=H2EAS4_9VIRU|nr:hypothetical protein c7_R434 [Megavirus courdo7]
MTSVFFRLSENNFLEASRTHAKYKDFALRIVTYKTDGAHFIYLPDVSLNELSILASIMQAQLVTGISNYRYLYYY